MMTGQQEFQACRDTYCTGDNSWMAGMLTMCFQQTFSGPPAGDYVGGSSEAYYYQLKSMIAGTFDEDDLYRRTCDLFYSWFALASLRDS